MLKGILNDLKNLGGIIAKRFAKRPIQTSILAAVASVFAPAVVPIALATVAGARVISGGKENVVSKALEKQNTKMRENRAHKKQDKHQNQWHGKGLFGRIWDNTKNTAKLAINLVKTFPQHPVRSVLGIGALAWKASYIPVTLIAASVIHKGNNFISKGLERFVKKTEPVAGEENKLKGVENFISKEAEKVKDIFKKSEKEAATPVQTVSNDKSINTAQPTEAASKVEENKKIADKVFHLKDLFHKKKEEKTVSIPKIEIPKMPSVKLEIERPKIAVIEKNNEKQKQASPKTGAKKAAKHRH